MDAQDTNLISGIFHRLWNATTLWFAAASEGNEAAAGSESGQLPVGRMTRHNGEALRSNNNDWQELNQYVLIRLGVVGLLFQAAYSGALSPPGGVYQDGQKPGRAIMSDTTPFRVFKICNDLVLYSCLALLSMLISLISTKWHPVYISVLSHVIDILMWACLAFTTAAYMSASWVTSIPGQQNQAMLVIVPVVACSMLGLVFIGLRLMQMRNMLYISSIHDQIVQQAGFNDSNAMRSV